MLRYSASALPDWKSVRPQPLTSSVSPREHMLAPQVAHAARGVSGRMQGLQPFRAERERVAILELHRGGRDAAAFGGRRLRAGVLGELARARDVIGMRMRFHRPRELEAAFPQQREVALDLLVHGVDDQRVARIDVEQHVRVGARYGIEQLDRIHGRTDSRGTNVWRGTCGAPRVVATWSPAANGIVATHARSTGTASERLRPGAGLGGGADDRVNKVSITMIAMTTNTIAPGEGRGDLVGLPADHPELGQALATAIT